MCRDFVSINNRPRRTKKRYYPSNVTSEHRVNYKSILANYWFDMPATLGAAQSSIQLSHMKDELKWLRPTIQESLEASPFEDYMTMMSFFNSYGKISKPVEMYTYGGGHKHNFLEDVLIFNTYPMKKALHSAEQGKYIKDYAWMCVEDRFLNWSTLLGSLKKVPKCVFDDINLVTEELDHKMLDEALHQTDPVRRQFAVTISTYLRGGTVLDLVRQSKSGCLFYIKPQSNVAGKFRGKGIILLRLTSTVVRVEVEDEYVTKIVSEEKSNTSDLLPQLSFLGLIVNHNTKFKTAAVRADEKLLLTYDSGFRLCTKQGGYGMRFFGFKTHVISNIIPPIDSDILPYLFDILNNTCQTLDMTNLIKSKHELAPLIIHQIKETRKGTMLIRLSERVDWSEMEPLVIEEKQDEQSSKLVGDDDKVNMEELLMIMENNFELFGDEEEDIQDLAGVIEDIEMDAFNTGRRLWSVELRIDSPCYIKWASIANSMISAFPQSAIKFMTDEEKNKKVHQLKPSKKVSRALSKWFHGVRH